jgi:hypothetical protein
VLLFDRRVCSEDLIVRPSSPTVLYLIFVLKRGIERIRKEERRIRNVQEKRRRLKNV